MGYEVVESRDVSPTEDRPCELRQLTAGTDPSTLAVNRYRVDPGEQIPIQYHYHDEQKQAFYVLSGTLVVETPDGAYTVDSGSLFAVTPESAHRAHNPADADAAVEVLAMGAPADEGSVYPYEPDDGGS